MLIMQDALLAVLAAVGLTSLIWLAFGVLRRPRRAAREETLALILARGSGETLEQSVRELARLRTDERIFSRIVILDRGLDAEARVRAELLCRGVSGVELIDLRGRSYAAANNIDRNGAGSHFPE